MVSTTDFSRDGLNPEYGRGREIQSKTCYIAAPLQRKKPIG